MKKLEVVEKKSKKNKRIKKRTFQKARQRKKNSRVKTCQRGQNESGDSQKPKKFRLTDKKRYENKKEIPKIWTRPEDKFTKNTE
ncbi:hypothetical protein HYE05_02700 [Mycoplasmopsis bovis]|nr:hypothetical protein [Mycoplasmopsis bovis]QQH27602.1 hypothetical protein HYE05_02700 [Mycoplasmopsis bovis]